jgi:dephospho-CoA kinase
MVLGITGISGSGKHTVAEYLRKKGWTVFDTDSIAHYLYRPYTGAWKEISTQFGEKILNQDDTINRVKLGQIVFNEADPEGAEAALKKLNGIIHPHMKIYIANELHHYGRKKIDVAIVSALWEEFEKGFCEKILLLKADLAIRKKRIMSRDGIPEKMYGLRVKAQTEPKNPDFVIENNGTVEELIAKLNEMFSSIIKK